MQSLIRRPFTRYNQENPLKAIVMGSLVLAKESFKAIGSSITEIYETLKNGVSVLVEYGTRHQEVKAMVVDRDLFEDDIE